MKKLLCLFLTLAILLNCAAAFSEAQPEAPLFTPGTYSGEAQGIFVPVKVTVKVSETQIETVLIQQGYAANYQIIVDRVNNSDTLDVLIEMNAENFSDSLSKITAKEKALVAELKSMLGIYANVHLVAPKSITRSEGKAVRIIDKRKI